MHLFGHLAEARLTDNLDKCEFARVRAIYLGQVVRQGQVRPVDAKVQAVIPQGGVELSESLYLFLICLFPAGD